MRRVTGWVMVGTVALAVGGALTSAQGADKSLFEQRCAGCHGKDGQAETGAGKAMHIKPWRNDAELGKMSDARIRELIVDGVKTDGKQRMPANRTLKPEQVDELLAEVRKLSK